MDWRDPAIAAVVAGSHPYRLRRAVASNRPHFPVALDVFDAIVTT